MKKCWDIVLLKRVFFIKRRKNYYMPRQSYEIEVNDIAQKSTGQLPLEILFSYIVYDKNSHLRAFEISDFFIGWRR